MSLEVGEIRARAEEFEPRLREELLQARAGLKTRPEFSRLYGDHPDLGDRELLADVERAMAGSEPEEERRLRCLLEWLAGHQVGRAVATLTDEYFAWEATTTVDLQDQETPLRQLARVVARETDPVRRHRLQGMAEEVLEDSVSLRFDILERERDAVRDLGYGSYLEALERFGRQSYRPLLGRGQRVAEATEGLYREHLREHLAREGVDPPEATKGDELALRRRPFSTGPESGPTVEVARDLLARDLSALDLEMSGVGEVRMDVEQRPLKRTESFCAAPRVPDRVVGVVAGYGGWSDAHDFLGVAGTALSLSHVDPDLPFEDRYLGNPSMGYAWDALFRELLSRKVWLERLEMSPGRREALARFAAWVDLLDFRRDVARLDFELDLWEEREPAPVVQEFGDRMAAATGFRPAPQSFLEVVGGGLQVARRLRGRLLADRLGAELDERFGEDWFRNPAAGPFLAELLAGGWREARLRLRPSDEEGERDAGEVAGRFRRRLGGAP